MKAVTVFAAIIEYFKGQILKALQTSHGDKVNPKTETKTALQTSHDETMTSKTETKTDSSSKKTDTFTNDDFHWVLTVPAIWDLKAKQFMRDAAEKVHV